jgi:HEAT repeat protein
MQLLFAGLSVALVVGCTSNPFAAKPRHVEGVRSPSERANQLRELAEKAKDTTDPAQRETVCRQLAQEIRTENDPNLRCEILRTIAAYGGPICDTVLKAAVSDPDGDVRVVVCGLWGLKGTAEAGQVLASMFNSDVDRDVRIAAARGLGGVHDPIVVATLGPAVNDKDPAIQHRAVVSLESSTGIDLGQDVKRWQEWVKTGGKLSGVAPSIADRMSRLFW